VIPPASAFRLPARDRHAPLPALRIPGVRLPAPQSAAGELEGAASPCAASPFAVSSQPSRQAAPTTRQVRRAALLDQRRKVRVPVVSSSYAVEPAPPSAAKPAKDLFASVPAVESTTVLCRRRQPSRLLRRRWQRARVGAVQGEQACRRKPQKQRLWLAQ
jgi:hypothetical protein